MWGDLRTRAKRPLLHFFTLLIGLVLLVIFGCAGGRVGYDPLTVKIDDFIEGNYNGLIAAYSGIKEKPGSILFEPKENGEILLGEGWHPIQDKAELKQLVENMRGVYLRYYKGVIGALGPQLFDILDKRGEKIGYLYTPFDLISTTPVRADGQKYRVDPITELDVRNQNDQLMRPRERRMPGKD